MQDTDGDGLGDALELTFSTSPILDDTDGDGEDDRAERLLLNRDPLVSDLPVPQVVVQDLELRVEVLSSYTDEAGATQSLATTTSSQFLQSRSESLSRGDTRSMEIANKTSQEFGVEVGAGSWPLRGRGVGCGGERHRAVHRHASPLGGRQR